MSCVAMSATSPFNMKPPPLCSMVFEAGPPRRPLGPNSKVQCSCDLQQSARKVVVHELASIRKMAQKNRVKRVRYCTFHDCLCEVGSPGRGAGPQEVPHRAVHPQCSGDWAVLKDCVDFNFWQHESDTKLQFPTVVQESKGQEEGRDGTGSDALRKKTRLGIIGGECSRMENLGASATMCRIRSAAAGRGIALRHQGLNAAFCVCNKCHYAVSLGSPTVHPFF